MNEENAPGAEESSGVAVPPTTPEPAPSAPIVTAAPAPAATPAPEVGTSSELAELRAQLNALSASLQTRAEREQDTERLRYLRAQGLHKWVLDEDLGSLPKVDVSTPAGKAKIEEWRQKRTHLFVPKVLSDAEVAQLVKPRLDQMKTTKLVDKDAILRRMGGG